MPKQSKLPNPNAPVPGARARTTTMTALSDAEWDGLVATYKREDIVKEAVQYVKDTKRSLDVEALEQELKRYLVYSEKKNAGSRKILPETLETALEVMHEIMHYKDRTSSMWIELRRLQTRLNHYYNAASSRILIKRDVQNLRSEGQRTAVVNAVLYKLTKRIDLVDNLIEMCEHVSRSLYQTYQSIDLAIDIVKIMIYRRPDPNYVPDAEHSKTRTGINKVSTKTNRSMV